MDIRVKGWEVMRWGRKEVKTKAKERVLRRGPQRRRGHREEKNGHDVSCPHAGMVFCYDYA
jgi:hypothetical protein